MSPGGRDSCGECVGTQAEAYRYRAGRHAREGARGVAGFHTGRVVVGHFVQIDVSVLRKELRHQQYEVNNPAIDTARAHRWILQNVPYLEDLEQRMATSASPHWR